MPRYRLVFEADTIDELKNILKNASKFNMSGMDYITAIIRAGGSTISSGPPQEERGSWVGFDG